MNWKTWIPLILAAVLGLVAAKAGRDLIIRAQHAGATAGKFTRIVAAKSDLPPGHALAESDLILVATESQAVPSNAFRQPAELSGRILTTSLVKGQSILETFLAPSGSAAGLQAMVPPGMRAITVDVTEASGLGGLLTPGCCVDVVSTLQDEGIGQQVARTIVGNAKVLAVGQRLMVSSRKDGEEGARAKTVSLLVSPRDAEAIELACNTGRTRLVLRGSLDRGDVMTTGVTLAELLGAQRKEPKPLVQASLPTTRPIAPPPTEVAAAPKVPVARCVEVIRNGVATQVQLPASAGTMPHAVTSGNNEVEPAFPGRAP